MKKLLLAGAALIIATSFAAPVYAEDADHDEARVEHYEGKDFASNEEALETLNVKNVEIAEILKTEELSGAQLETIHETSYTLENAIDKLIAEKAAAQSQLEAVDEAVQAIHHASENHEEAKVREWFTKLEAAVAAVKISKKEAAPRKPDPVQAAE